MEQGLGIATTGITIAWQDWVNGEFLKAGMTADAFIKGVTNAFTTSCSPDVVLCVTELEDYVVAAAACKLVAQTASLLCLTCVCHVRLWYPAGCQ